jgi:hypothetical protein
MEAVMPNSSSSSPRFVEPDAQSDLTNDDGESNEIQLFLDEDLIEQIEAQALIDHGYSREENGRPTADFKQVQLAVLQAIANEHVANNAKELSKRAVTKFELYSEVLPRGPGVSSLPTSPEEEAARDRLMRQVWNYTNTGPSGFVQKNIVNTGMILCQAKVARTKLNQETGTKEPTTEIGRFITGDRELILTYYTGPAGAAFLRAARKLDNQLGLVTGRRPELALPVARQLGVVVKQAVAAVPHADPRQATALTAGSSANGDIDSA